MAGLLSAASTLLEFAGNVSEKGVAKGTLATLRSKDVQLIRTDGSMMKLLGKYIVEPVAVISDDLKDVEELDHVLGLHMDMFTGYYMQVFDILRNHYGLDVNTVIDILATDNGGLERVIVGGLDKGIELTTESNDYLGDLIECGIDLEAASNSEIYDELRTSRARQKGKNSADYNDRDKLIMLERDKAEAKQNATNKTNYSPAAIRGASNKEYSAALAKKRATYKADGEYREALKKVPPGKRLPFTNKDIVNTPVNLSEAHKDLLIPNAIQRTLEISVDMVLPEPGTDGQYHTRTINIPVTIKLAVIFTSAENIINAISTKSDDYTFSSRLDDYRAGAISLTDFLFASDIINKYKHKRLKDKDALLKLNNFRELSSNSKIVNHGFVGFEKYYNMYILSPTVKSMIEKEVRSKFKSKGKDKFLEAGNGFSVTVLDPDYERISIMVKDIRGKTDLSLRNAVKKDSKGSDYSEIIKALLANKPPVF